MAGALSRRLATPAELTHTPKMLAVTNLEASIGGSRILRGVSFTVRERSVFCLMGRNGVGKTSTLKSNPGTITPAGTAFRFEPGDTREVELVALACTRVVFGFNAKINGPLP